MAATGITTSPEEGGTIEHAQACANQESPKTAKSYDRTVLRTANPGTISMSWPRRECKNWKEFNEFVEPVTNYPPSGYGTIFRGQACLEWPLKHSLSRKLPMSMDEESRIDTEKAAMTRFKQQGHLLIGPSSLPKPDDLLGWWAVMQHMSIKRRFSVLIMPNTSKRTAFRIFFSLSISLSRIKE